MARAVKSRALKGGIKQKAAKKPQLKSQLKPQLNIVSKAKVAAPVKTTAKVAKPIATPVDTAAKKTVSQKLLETIQRRNQQKAAVNGANGQKAFGARPPGRRGRRPKNVEYTPGQNEEESYVYEAENENLTYDTGIRVSEKKDDAGVSLDRFEDFDEELNFDW